MAEETDRINAADLPAETTATLDGSEKLVGFDTAEGKQIPVNVLRAYMANIMQPPRKVITCNATEADTSVAGFNFKQEETWSGITANHFPDGYVSAGNYNGSYQIETAANKVILRFVTQPATSVKITVVAIPTKT